MKQDGQDDERQRLMVLGDLKGGGGGWGGGEVSFRAHSLRLVTHLSFGKALT